MSAGGPDVLTRREIMELVANHGARIVGVPVWLARVGAVAVRAVHPRMGQFAQFAVGLAQHDVIAPTLGTTRLSEYLVRPGRLDPKSRRSARYPSTARGESESTAAE